MGALLAADVICVRRRCPSAAAPLAAAAMPCASCRKGLITARCYTKFTARDGTQAPKHPS